VAGNQRASGALERLKILWLNHRCPTHPAAGGAEVHLHEIARRLVKQGHDVTLVSEYYDGAQSFEQLDGIQIHRIGGKYSSHLLLPLKCVSELRRREYDVVVDDMAHGVPWFSPLYGRLPVVAIVHHVHRELLLKQLRFPFSALAYTLEQLLPLIYRKAPFIAVSESTRDRLIRFGIPRENITVVHNGLDHEIYRPTDRKSPHPVLLYLGRLMRYKRVDHVLEVFNRVIKHTDDAVLKIVGTGEQLQQIRQSVHDKGLDRQATAYGYLPFEEKVGIIQSSWLNMICSVREGWPLAPVEAAACGTPTVAYDVPGVRDTVKNDETGILVPDGDLEALTGAVLRVIEDDELRFRLSRNAVEWANQFTWERCAAETHDVLRRTVHRSGRPPRRHGARDA